jgi:hypothetical protein
LKSPRRPSCASETVEAIQEVDQLEHFGRRYGYLPVDPVLEDDCRDVEPLGDLQGTQAIDGDSEEVYPGGRHGRYRSPSERAGTGPRAKLAHPIACRGRRDSRAAVKDPSRAL